MDGFIVINKEKGYTSHDVVAKLRGMFHQKRIGHTGTLDPDATGVLPVALGKATKLVEMFTDGRKEYRAVLRLGVVTDTQDMSGAVLSESPVDVTEEQVYEAISSFVGEQDQIPPMYSAKKIDGKKLYELAREGREVERKAARITIFGITVESMELPLVTFTVKCSKGTYIRTLCHDIGAKLGCGGAMQELLRTGVGSITLDDAVLLSEVQHAVDENRQEELIIPIRQVLKDLPVCVCPDTYSKALLNGNKLECSWVAPAPEEGMQVLVTDERDGVIGIYACHAGELKPEKMLL